MNLRAIDVPIEFADLGDFGMRVLGEYDPSGPVIRVNSRYFSLTQRDTREFRETVAHERYHHLEHIGAVESAPSRAESERRAERYALACVTNEIP